MLAYEDPMQLNVLVVDDDPDMRSLLCQIVSRRGHLPYAVDSAEAGLELLPSLVFQVAFLDQDLPGMEGLLLGEFLRRNNPDMAVALVTGRDALRLENKTRELEVKLIAKPFEVGEIMGVLDGYLSRMAADAAIVRAEANPDHTPPIAEFCVELGAYYDMPNVPQRIEERLAGGIARALRGLRSEARYNESERVMALAGLLTAKVLGIRLPKGAEGLSMYAEYDRLMGRHDRRPEFGHDEEDED